MKVICWILEMIGTPLAQLLVPKQQPIPAFVVSEGYVYSDYSEHGVAYQVTPRTDAWGVWDGID
jgi:hypothetical protein